jgi:nitrogen fixation/metabolism regulation signal transduction histidine kinase
MTDSSPVRRIPWWGRLELRVIAALVVLGTMCVGASAYLVQLSVAYFDTRVESALRQGQQISEEIEPFHQALVDAQIEAFEGRARAMAMELAFDDARPDAERIGAMLERETDVVRLVLQRDGGEPIAQVREETFPQSDFQWFDVTADVGPPSASTGKLEVVFRIDPEIDARYQALGERKREIGHELSSRKEIEKAVMQVVGGASVIVLLVSLLVGFGVARSMTRKVTELTSVMTRVGQGDLTARARRLGRDELGQLAASFNEMLEELDHAQKRLAYLQRIGAWQEMARRIAHEIKNPLTPIWLAVQQLRDKDPGLSPAFSELIRASADIVEDEVAGLRRMVTSFSSFAKVPEVRLAPESLARVLAEFERAYGHLTDREQDELVVRPAEPDVTIAGDRQLLKQALVNLVENAVLSAHEAGVDPVRVEVEAVRRGTWVEITVDDNGPGIDEARRERVFEPYETSRAHGTGLGLAIVKKVVLDHGGEIRVESSPLGGARFVLRLPVQA